MGENEKPAEGTLYIIEPDGTKTPIGKIGDPLGSLEIKPEEEAKAQEDLDRCLAIAFKQMLDQILAAVIAQKYYRVVHFIHHGKTERVRKKNHHRLKRAIRKELCKYANLV